MLAIRVKICVEVIPNSGCVDIFPSCHQKFKLMLQIEDTKDETVSEFVESVLKILELDGSAHVVSLRVKDFVVPLDQRVSIFRDNDRLRLVVLLAKDSESMRAGKELHSKKNARATRSVKKIPSSSSCIRSSSSDSDSDSSGNATSDSKEFGRKQEASSKKRRLTSAGSANPSVSDTRSSAALNKGEKSSTIGLVTLDSQYVWQMMMAEQQQSRGAASSVATTHGMKDATSAQSNGQKKKSANSLSYDAPMSASGGGNDKEKKKRAKQNNTVATTQQLATSTNDCTDNPFLSREVKNSETGKANASVFVPASVSELIAGDCIRYRRPVLDNGVPGVTEVHESNVIYVDKNTIQLQDSTNKSDMQMLDVCVLLDIQVLRDHDDLAESTLYNGGAHLDGDVFEDGDQAGMLLDEFADLINAKRLQV